MVYMMEPTGWSNVPRQWSCCWLFWVVLAFDPGTHQCQVSILQLYCGQPFVWHCYFQNDCCSASWQSWAGHCGVGPADVFKVRTEGVPDAGTALGCTWSIRRNTLNPFSVGMCDEMGVG